MRSIILIAHNVRSTHNVGSLLRTADGLGIAKVYLTGYTPHPTHKNDPRLPHIAQKLTKQINKTALGAETTVDWEFAESIEKVIVDLRSRGYLVVALEQADDSIKLPAFKPPEKVALVVGREVEGLEPEVLKLADHIVEIPTLGQKESFNVAVAAAMALYHCRFYQ